jgi:putative spermidine/putrescine transport system substrate-binding protein
MRSPLRTPMKSPMNRSQKSRSAHHARKVLGAVCVVGLVAACGAPESKNSSNAPSSDEVKLPSKPVTLNIIDVAGNLQLTQKIFDNYKAKHPELVSKITTSKVKAPELAGKVKAQQDAGRLDIDMVLTGTDGLSSGLKQDLWVDLLGKYKDKLPDLNSIYLEPAVKMQELAQGKGVVVTYNPSGPLIEYNPKTVPNPPKTAEELLAWAKAHPKKLLYARPANSGPGRAWLMGLPYILGDSNPKDPINGWNKSWAYLKDLNNYIEYYPGGTTQTMQEFADGTRDIIMTTTGWDINARALGQVPKDMKIQALNNFTWLTDAHYMVVPKGISSEKLAVVLDFMKFALSPEQQAYTYDRGYLYPGPAAKEVRLSMAPAESQKVIADYGRPEYDKLISDNPKTPPLDADTMVAAFDKWDKEVGGAKVKK